MKDISIPIGVKCLNPQKIVNPYTRELLVVPCRHCDACRAAKNSRWALACQLESTLHDKTMFITLTYANEYVPRMRYDKQTHSFYDLETSEVLYTESFSERYIDDLTIKCNLDGDLPYNRKTDLQKFIKRLRYYANKKFGAKIRYYAVAEMGPVHFRPHFHLLLWSDNKQFLSKIGYYIYKAWKYGLYDAEIARDAAASYVASYLNSDSRLPTVFQNNAVRPFSVHSAHLGTGILQNARKEIYERSASEIVRKSVTIGDKQTDFTLWRSFYAYFFPKVRGYADFNAREKLYAYSIYEEVINVLPRQKSVIDYAKYIYSMCSIFADCNAVDACPIDSSGRVLQIIRFFSETEARFYETDDVSINRAINRIYTQLLISRHFLTYVCDSPRSMIGTELSPRTVESEPGQFNEDNSDNSYSIPTNSTTPTPTASVEVEEEDDTNGIDTDIPYYPVFPTTGERKRKIRLIDEFYKQMEYMRLTEWYESQQLFYESDLCGDEGYLIDGILPFFYDNYTYDISRYAEMKVFCRFDSSVKELMEKRIKHKKLNDANKKFIYDFGSLGQLNESYLFDELR